MAEVYALVCPDSGAFRYIGMSTVSALSRFRHHLGPDALGPVRDWVSSLREAKKLPELRVIATGLTRQEATSLERRLILETRGLLNRTVRRRTAYVPRADLVQYDADAIPGPNMLKWWKERTNLPHL